MSDIHELNKKSFFFFFVDDLNAHHQEWLKFESPTDCHGIVAFDFVNLSGCSKLIKEPKQKLDYCLDLFLIDVAGMVDPSLGNFDHFSISFSVKMGVFEVTCRLTLPCYRW